MNVFYLVLRSISGRQFRSFLIAVCIMAISGFLLTTTLMAKGQEHSLNIGLERLGSDITIVPIEKRAEAEAAFLLGKPDSDAWMPEENLDKVARLEGVEQVSPQLYLQSLTGAACCAAWELFIIAIDPETDFTIQPWLKEKLNRPLGLGEAIGGDYITAPPGTPVTLDGYQLNLAGKLHPTGIWLDQTIFFSLETAKAMMRQPEVSSVIPSDMPDNAISAIIVKVKPGYSIETMAIETMLAAPATWSIRSTQLMRLLAAQRAGLLRSLF